MQYRYFILFYFISSDLIEFHSISFGFIQNSLLYTAGRSGMVRSDGESGDFQAAKFGAKIAKSDAFEGSLRRAVGEGADRDERQQGFGIRRVSSV